MKHVALAVPVMIVAVALMLAALGRVSGVADETRPVERAPAAAASTLVTCVLPEALNGAAIDLPTTSVQSPRGCAELPLSRFSSGGAWLAEC